MNYFRTALYAYVGILVEYAVCIAAEIRLPITPFLPPTPRNASHVSDLTMEGLATLFHSHSSVKFRSDVVYTDVGLY